MPLREIDRYPVQPQLPRLVLVGDLEPDGALLHADRGDGRPGGPAELARAREAHGWCSPPEVGVTRTSVWSSRTSTGSCGGWGQYFRTGNAANHFERLDWYVVGRLRGLLRGRVCRLVGRRLGVVRSSRPWGSLACAARFGIRGRCMLRTEVHLVSRVREIRMHGLNGGLAFSRLVPPTGAQ